GISGAGYLFGSRNNSFSDDELLILITPRKLRIPLRDSRTIYAGRGDATGRVSAGAAAPPPPPATPEPEEPRPENQNPVPTTPPGAPPQPQPQPQPQPPPAGPPPGRPEQ